MNVVTLTEIYNFVDVHECLVYKIVINATPFAIYNIAEHLKNNGPFYHNTDFSHRILYPSLLDIPHAQKHLALGIPRCTCGKKIKEAICRR